MAAITFLAPGYGANVITPLLGIDVTTRSLGDEIQYHQNIKEQLLRIYIYYAKHPITLYAYFLVHFHLKN